MDDSLDGMFTSPSDVLAKVDVQVKVIFYPFFQPTIHDKKLGPLIWTYRVPPHHYDPGMVFVKLFFLP